MPRYPIWIDEQDLDEVSGHLAQLLQGQVLPDSPFQDIYEQVVEHLTPYSVEKDEESLCGECEAPLPENDPWGGLCHDCDNQSA